MLSNGNSDCDSGLVCTKAANLANEHDAVYKADRCCPDPADRKSNNSHCKARSSDNTGTEGGAGGMSGSEGGASSDGGTSSTATTTSEGGTSSSSDTTSSSGGATSST